VQLAGLYVAAGYAVLVPERRGYGRSDGPAWSEAVGRDVGSVLIARLQAEAEDVLTAVEYLRSVPSADISRLGIAGWSLGGIVTLFANRSDATRAAGSGNRRLLPWPVVCPVVRSSHIWGGSTTRERLSGGSASLPLSWCPMPRPTETQSSASYFCRARVWLLLRRHEPDPPPCRHPRRRLREKTTTRT
jgi:hypothetical protein